MTIKFYHAPNSSAAVTAAVLQELEAATGRTLAERVEVTLHDGTRKPEYLAINPNGQVPAIVHDGVPVWESAAITMYLAELYGVDTGLYPAAGTARRGEALKWIVWSNVNIPVQARPVMRLVRGETDPDPEVQAVRVADADKARAELVKLLTVLDRGLDGRKFLTGDEYCLADTHIWSFMSFIRLMGVDLSGLNNLNAWIERIAQRPALKGL